MSRNVLIVTPKIGGGGVSIKELEKINASEISLTYENIYDQSITTLRSTANVALKGTSHSYPSVTRYAMISGSFFSDEALDNKNRVAVMNKKAAFDLFGTLDVSGNEIRICQKPYVVTGVIDDTEEKMNVYIPATCLGDTAETVLISLSPDSGITEESAKNGLKNAGISEFEYHFINLGQITQMMWQLAFASLEIAFIFLLFLAAKEIIRHIIEIKLKLTICHKDNYLGELMKTEAKSVTILLILIILIVNIIALGFVIFLSLTEKVLAWNSFRNSFITTGPVGSTLGIAKAEQSYLLSQTLLIGFIAFLITWASPTTHLKPLADEFDIH